MEKSGKFNDLPASHILAVAAAAAKLPQMMTGRRLPYGVRNLSDRWPRHGLVNCPKLQIAQNMPYTRPFWLCESAIASSGMTLKLRHMLKPKAKFGAVNNIH
jgi:hypothetical protein